MRWFGKMGLAPLVTSMFSPDKSFDRQGLTIFALSSFNELRNLVLDVKISLNLSYFNYLLKLKDSLYF